MPRNLAPSRLSNELRQYLIITTNYWVFTLTDGALRMLIVLYFHTLGFDPLKIALLFLFYEVFGVITNLVGGWLGARLGLNTIMNIGLGIQIIALSMLLVPTDLLSVIWVMVAQALSGIAKDLNKMSAKSAIKTLVPENAQRTLFKWVAILTGSKNALKGVGFFLGGALLTLYGFQNAILIMVTVLVTVWTFSLITLDKKMGVASGKPKFVEMFSKSSSINILSLARLFLFGARDVWFVIGLPIYLSQSLDWQHWTVGVFFATWIIAYGFVQSLAPTILDSGKRKIPNGSDASIWCSLLTAVTLAITLSFAYFQLSDTQWILIGGLLIFGAVFAINSALHSYLIVSYADANNVSMDVGFYYMANAMGRLIGTVLSGLLFQSFGLLACLIASALFLMITTLVSLKLPNQFHIEQA